MFQVLLLKLSSSGLGPERMGLIVDEEYNQRADDHNRSENNEAKELT